MSAPITPTKGAPAKVAAPASPAPAPLAPEMAMALSGGSTESRPTAPAAAASAAPPDPEVGLMARIAAKIEGRDGRNKPSAPAVESERPTSNVQRPEEGETAAAEPPEGGTPNAEAETPDAVEPEPPVPFTAEEESAIAARIAAVEETWKGKLAEAQKGGEEIEALRARTVDLESRLSTVDTHNLLLADDPALVARWENEFHNFNAWAKKNWDGVPASDDGTRPEIPAEAIRGRLAELERVRDEVLPKARQLHVERQKHDAIAKEHYPELFKADSPAFQTRHAFLRQVPALRQFADVNVMLGDALAGEKVRRGDVAFLEAALAKAKKLVRGSTESRPTTNGHAKPGAKAPNVPVLGQAAPRNGAALKPGPVRNGVPDVDKFIQGGATRGALMEAMGGGRRN